MLNEKQQKVYEEHRKNWDYICGKTKYNGQITLIGILGMIFGFIFWQPLWFASLVFSLGHNVYSGYWIFYRMWKCSKCWDKIDELEK